MTGVRLYRDSRLTITFFFRIEKQQQNKQTNKQTDAKLGPSLTKYENGIAYFSWKSSFACP